MKTWTKNGATLMIFIITLCIADSMQDHLTAIAAPPVQSIGAIPPLAVYGSDQTSSIHIAEPHRPYLANVSTTSISVNYLVQGSHDAYSNLCSTWPDQPKVAIDYAANIWARLVSSPISVKINACWTDLGSNILGYGGAISFQRDFAGSIPGFWYPAALANAVASTDLNDTDGIDWDGDGKDADAEINVSINRSAAWYLAIDDNISAGRYDLASVVLHEIGHGLGFAGWMNYSGGQGNWGLGTDYPGIYDRFIVNEVGQNIINTSLFPNPSLTLGNQLTSNHLYFDGPNARAANGGNRPQIYAPSTWRSGPSYSHLDEIYNNTPNALMTWSFGYQEVIHDPGPIMLGILNDLGWNAQSECYTLTTSTSPNQTGSISANPAPNCGGDTYFPQTNVNLTANPISGYVFSGWGNILVRTPSTSLVMDSDKKVTAIFSAPQNTIYLPLVIR